MGDVTPSGGGEFGTNFKFSNDNSEQLVEFNNIKIPVQGELDPGNTYWILASAPDDPQGTSGLFFDYTTSFYGKAITPEPFTLPLLYSIA